MSRSAYRILTRSVHLGELPETEVRKRAGGQPHNPCVLQPRRRGMEEHQEAGKESKVKIKDAKPLPTSTSLHYTQCCPIRKVCVCVPSLAGVASGWGASVAAAWGW